MKTYKCYESEDKISAKGNSYKKLVLQEDGAPYPLKNVTLFNSHPLFEDIVPGWKGELEILEEDSGRPNPKAPGKNYINRTVASPNQAAPKKPAADAPQKPRGDVSLETYNLVNLKLIPMVEKLYREVIAISGRQERQMGLDPKAIDESMGVKDVVDDEEGLPF